jgi:hypothetical protein
MLIIASAVIFGSEFLGTHDHVLLLQIQDFSNPESQVAVFISPRKNVAQLYPQVLCSLFIISYDSWGCGGCIRIASTLASRLVVIKCNFTSGGLLLIVLAPSPLRFPTRVFSAEPLRFSSDEEMGLALTNKLLFFKCTYCRYNIGIRGYGE